MSINNPAAFCAGLWDWDFLMPAFSPTRIRVTDIDGCVERNGALLFIETKKPNVAIPEGQARMFRQATARNDLTVLVLWGEHNQPEQMQVWHAGNPSVVTECDTADVVRTVRDWFEGRVPTIDEYTDPFAEED